MANDVVMDVSDLEGCSADGNVRRYHLDYSCATVKSYFSSYDVKRWYSSCYL